MRHLDRRTTMIVRVMMNAAGSSTRIMKQHLPFD